MAPYSSFINSLNNHKIHLINMSYRGSQTKCSYGSAELHKICKFEKLFKVYHGSSLVKSWSHII